jgi:hypothetical protein
MPQDLITSKERFRAKSRKFRLIHENGNIKLGQEVKIKEKMQESEKVKYSQIIIYYFDSFFACKL